ncbi:MAG: transcription antitermination factor NusB [Gammaproteobacteria bacterium]|nr:transcription antitermination factor NusB [Gammaproteobacteria bacterium]MDE2022652.1 transcription antitermination factor NusB [Gammaproteobacteria bacterium]MDE2138946.1 transcription antitermination factor NusB [Gammaproteobacteria bacterium]MDE2273224.1 transcription antitermination factor NusB [Gammaproteobacteria bacterium]
MAKGNSRGTRARSRARRLALQGLYQWQLSGGLAKEISLQLLASQNVRDTDSEYFESLLGESIADCQALEMLFGNHLDRPLAQLDPVERGILLLGACELKSHPEVPYRVVLNEAVELTKRFGAEDAHKYINAVLECVCREVRSAEFKPEARVGGARA